MKSRLVTIPFSHYCEKARWAADHVGLDYREEKYLPGVHIPVVRGLEGRTVPILVTPEGTLRDSTDILRFLDRTAAPGRRLYPEDAAQRREVEELEDRFDEKLGPAARLYAYHHGLAHTDSLRRIVAPSLSAAQRLAFRALLPLLRPLIRKAYRINPASAERAEATIRATFAEVSERLASGRRYLVGDTFTAADLTFASLAAPSLMPPDNGVYASALDGEPPGLGVFVRSLRETAAGAHATRMYREHRRAAGAVAAA